MQVDTTLPLIRARHLTATQTALRELFRDQEAAAVAGRQLDAGWDDRLASTIYARNRNTAADVGARVAALLGGGFVIDYLDEWLTTNAELSAGFINGRTRAQLEDADEPASVFSSLLGAGVVRYSRSLVQSAAGVGANDAARASGVRSKSWQVNSAYPRSMHAALDGQTVRLSENFSNGMAWPGDPSGGADNNSGCRCSLVYSTGGS